MVERLNDRQKEILPDLAGKAALVIGLGGIDSL